MKTANLLAALAALIATPPLQAQEIIAWPIGTPSVMRSILPGAPVRPLPPRPLPPRPLPHPMPLPTPAPTPVVTPPDSVPLAVSGYHVSGKIVGAAAELTYDITFHNPTSRRLEGVLLIPIPDKTALSQFEMTVAGKTMKGELLEAAQARTVYENIVRRMQDPGLLELAGERMVRARVFPIEPGADVLVKMKVNQMLPRSGGLFSLHLPMRTAQMTGSSKAAGASVRLDVSAETPIRTLYSPLSSAKITRSGERSARIEYAQDGHGEDFSLFYSLAGDPVAAGLLTYREKGEDGFFLLSLAPKREPEAGKALPKDIVFIVDRSGSMEEGGKMAQAKAALAHCIGRLGEGDRFGIVDFATDVSGFDSALKSATADNKNRALRYIERIDAAGGTNIEAGLQEGLRLLAADSPRTPMIFFLTDGLPTVGQTSMETLLRQASEKNAGLKARVFSFGVGDDVNTLFLDKLAEANRGDRDYVRSGETIEAKVSTLYQKIARPALTDVTVSFEGVETSQVTPKRLGDLFYGSEITLAGRYGAAGKGKIIVSGKAGDKNARFEYPVEFPDSAETHAVVPRLWANHKVAAEMDALRTAGGTPSAEAVASIVKLARRYGIVTPYTSYLITEDGFDMPTAMREAEAQLGAMRMEAAASGRGDAGLARRAQNTSSFFSAMKAAAPASAPAFDGGGSGGARVAAVRGASSDELMFLAEKDAREELKKQGRGAVDIKRVGAKSFYRQGAAWVDGAYDKSAKTVDIRRGSEEFAALLSDMPALAQYAGLDGEVLVVYRGVAYRITN